MDQPGTITITDSLGVQIDVSIFVESKNQDFCFLLSSDCHRVNQIFSLPITDVRVDNGSVEAVDLGDEYWEIQPEIVGKTDFGYEFFNPYENETQVAIGSITVHVTQEALDNAAAAEAEKEIEYCSAYKRKDGNCYSALEYYKTLKCSQLHTYESDGS